MKPDLMKMKEIALVYLDMSGGFKKFVDDCKLYNDSRQSLAVFQFLISINPSDITELDAMLGDYVLHEPAKATQIFQSVCFTAVKTLSLIEQLQTEAQMKVVLKVTHLPSLAGYVLDLCKFPFDYTSQRFYMTEGIVVAMSIVTKYTQGARFICSEETCQFSEGFHHVRIHTPGATESAVLRTDFVCSLCTSPLREDVKYRVLGDKQVVEVIDSKAINAFQGFSTSNMHFRFQSLTVFLRGPFCISEKFKYLLSLTSSSCWQFTAIVAYNFASQVLPSGIYNTLKLAMLLSLVHTTDRDDSTPLYLDLLAITNDSLILERIMNYSVCLVPRGIRHFLSSDIFPTVSKDKLGTGTASIQAGSAILAKGGICFIGELSSHKKDKLEQLQTVLENRTATIVIPGKKYGQDCDQQVILPVQTSFWSFIDVDSSLSKKHVQKDATLIGQMDLHLISANLIEAFALVINCNESMFCNSNIPIVNFVLQKAVNPEKASYTVPQQFTTQDYEEFLAFSSHLQAELGPEAERLIHGYYLASRRVRTDPVNGSHLSSTSLMTLISLAEAHAKLSLRTKVLQEDVLIAVLLFESSLTLKHGASVFCVAPNAVFPFDITCESSLTQRDVYLEQCHQQLIQFIATYAPATHILSNED